ncbi:MAG: hypothetical protein NTW86_21015, partial [Candidatus Sumerlaeota bacterium]|nr:hypothetical protein [Candidatus Sumerlaeota bacterium]
MRRIFPLLSVALLSPAAAHAGDSRLGPLDVLKAGYPRAFFFRSSESSAANEEVTYEQWDAAFSRLDGIMGKALDEEVPGRMKRNPEFFTRFKKEHPEQAVLLHCNGNGTDPRFESSEYFAGHFLYYNGATISGDVPAEEGDTVIPVSDTSLFYLSAGRYKNANEELCMTRLGSDGKPDWNYAEQVKLSDIDEKGGTIKVQRGFMNTTPLEFKANQAYVAAHATRGPWGKESHLIWVFNYATTCPRDKNGKTCADVQLEKLKNWFAPDGVLGALDGLEFDASPWTKAGGRGRANVNRGADCDGDGVADYGMKDGVNVFGLGVFDMHKRLREAFGDDRLIMADGQSGGNSQRSFGLLNGIESEGWPILSDTEIVDWSGGLNRHFYWRDHAREPKLNYINHKFGVNDKDEGKKASPVHIARLVMAVAQMVDAAVTYSTQPRRAENELVGVWDELVKGAEKEKHWLGMPKGAPVRLGLQTPDLLKGAGAQVAPEFVSKWSGEGVSIAKSADGKALQLSSKGAPDAQMKAVFHGLQIPEGDLLISCTLSADPWTGYPTAVPRVVWLGCQSGGGELVSADLPKHGMCVRGEQEAPLDAERTSASFRYEDKMKIGKETHPAYSVHPPYSSRVGGGYVWWEKDVVVPTSAPTLQFLTGLSDQKGNSDGVVFRVIVRADGKDETAFEEWQKEAKWIARTVDLGKWAGK